MRHVPEKFPKVRAYQGESDLVHCVRRVVCLEKIDGANVRVGVHPEARGPDDVTVGGRELMSDEAGFSQPIVVDLVRRNPTLCDKLIALARRLGAPVSVYGEVCGGRIQRTGFIYGSRPHLLLFAARVGGVWIGPTQASPPPAGPSLPTLRQISEQVGVPCAPLLYEGPPDKAIFDALLERPSQHSQDQGFQRSGVDVTQEGIVIWSDPVLISPFGGPVAAKHKHPRRREYIPPGAREAALDSPEDFARRAVLPERIEHARQHLMERGRWTGDPQVDAPRLVKRVVQDVAREVPEYQTQIQRHGKKAVRAALEAAAAGISSG